MNKVGGTSHTQPVCFGSPARFSPCDWSRESHEESPIPEKEISQRAFGAVPIVSSCTAPQLLAICGPSDWFEKRARRAKEPTKIKIGRNGQTEITLTRSGRGEAQQCPKHSRNRDSLRRQIRRQKPWLSGVSKTVAFSAQCRRHQLAQRRHTAGEAPNFANLGRTSVPGALCSELYVTALPPRRPFLEFLLARTSWQAFGESPKYRAVGAKDESMKRVVRVTRPARSSRLARATTRSTILPTTL